MLDHVPAAGLLGSEMYTVCKWVLTCLRFTCLYGCTIGSPSGVVQITEVICSFRRRDIDAGATGGRPRRLLVTSPGLKRSGGIDLEMSRADVFSQFCICLAPVKRSPMQSRTCKEVQDQDSALRECFNSNIPCPQDRRKRTRHLLQEYPVCLSTDARSGHEHR